MEEDITPIVGAVTLVRQVVRVSGVEDIIVTDISDPVNGQVLRAIRIMGDGGALVFELQVSTDNAEKIKISSPNTIDF